MERPKTVNLYSSKTKNAREIPINKSIVWLEAWKKDYQFTDVTDEDYIFPSQDRSKPLSESFFTKLIKRIGEKAGIQRTITPYLFRRSRLTELYLSKGINDITHRKFAGHTTDSKMTAVYVAMDEADMQEAVRGLYDVELSPEEENDLKREMKEQGKMIDALNKMVGELIEKLK